MPVADLLGTNFLANVITQQVSGNSRKSPVCDHNINCPMCLSQGEPRPDRKYRCGIHIEPHLIWVYCYNCAFSTRYEAGERLSSRMQSFIEALGISHIDTKRLALHAASVRSMLVANPDAIDLIPSKFGPQYPPMDLPLGAKSLAEWGEEGCEDPDFIETIEYLGSRGDTLITASEYYWTPSTAHNLNHRLIIPFINEKQIVGWTARAVHPSVIPKYHNEVPTDLLFNTRAITHPTRKILIIVEGIFDALSLDCVGARKATLNDRQIAWLNATDKTKIVLPDRDQAGGRLIDVAVANRWHVAYPRLRSGVGFQNWWDTDIKDAADAVARYGRIYTMRSIIETATNQKIKIKMLKDRFF